MSGPESGALQFKATLQSLRWLRTESKERNGQTERWNMYDLGEGTEEITAEFYLKKKEIAALLTPDVKERLRVLSLERGPLP